MQAPVNSLQGTLSQPHTTPHHEDLLRTNLEHALWMTSVEIPLCCLEGIRIMPFQLYGRHLLLLLSEGRAVALLLSCYKPSQP